LTLPWFHYLAKLTRQPNLIKAMELGFNPLVPQKHEGKWGFPALSNPFSSADPQIKSAQLDAKANEVNRRLALAWALSAIVLGHDAGIDPATLTVLASEGGVDLATLEKNGIDGEFFKKWSRSAEELQYTLSTTNFNGKDVRQLNPQELQEAINLARSTIDRVQSRKGLRKLLADLRLTWRASSKHLFKHTATWGVAETKFLRNVEPNDFVTSQFWKQFFVDYLLAIVQMGLIGDRAKLEHPDHLAASKDHALWTTPGHRADMIDQVRIYGINVPSSMALVYQKEAAITEDQYEPIESITLRGHLRSDGLFKGLWSWTKGAANIYEANYGGIWLRGLVKSLKTIQAGFFWAMLARVAFGGQHFAAAVPAWLYTFMWGTWQYGWLWTPINRGNQIYGERLEGLSARLSNLKSRMGQGLRLQDDPQLASAYMELTQLYKESGSGWTKLFEDGVPFARAVLENPESPEAQAALRDLRWQGQVALNITEGRPPVITQPHPRVEWATTLFGAIVTTYWATTMSVQSFRSDINWWTKLPEVALASAALYTVTYFAPQILKKITDTLKASIEKLKTKTPNDPKSGAGKDSEKSGRCPGYLIQM
ncbi:MAG: hypothetical protein IT289_04190, partial [Oligoflexia bacterium]|nr:hypothetical protein [Oligoflexia bacterium]